MLQRKKSIKIVKIAHLGRKLVQVFAEDQLTVLRFRGGEHE